MLTVTAQPFIIPILCLYCTLFEKRPAYQMYASERTGGLAPTSWILSNSFGGGYFFKLNTLWGVFFLITFPHYLSCLVFENKTLFNRHGPTF